MSRRLSRVVPPPPHPDPEPENDPVEEPPKGIAARIASLQLGQVGRHPLGKPPPPPPPARRATIPSVPVPAPDVDTVVDEDAGSNEPPVVPPRRYKARQPSRTELVARGPEFMRAISRKPPPPPDQQEPYDQAEQESPPPPAIPPRRLPPMLTRLPTPPPEPEPESEPAAEVYHAEQEDYSEVTSSCLICHDFSHVDDHAASFPRHSVTSLDQLAYDLTAPWGSETEKFRAIFTWCHHNIAYDTNAFFSGNIRPATAASTLQSGLAVCDGYAGLFKYIAEKAGLQAHRVTGHGKGLGYTAVGPDALVPPFAGNHAWNCVLMDGRWHLIDSCWGAGAVDGTSYNKRFAPMWFTSSARQFGMRHFPEDPSYQLVPDEEGGPLSWEEYILVAEGPTLFNDWYTHSFAPDAVLPAEKYIQSGGWVTFRIDKLCEHMSRAEEDNWVYFIHTPDENKTPLVVDEQGSWSATVYLPRGGGDISLYYVTTFDREDAKGLPVDLFKSSIGRRAMSFSGLARWTAV